MTKQEFKNNFSSEFYKVKYDCESGKYEAAVHKIKMFGELHGVNVMLSFLTTVVASLEKEHQAELAATFYFKIK